MTGRPITGAELETWREVERAIAEVARELCRSWCPDSAGLHGSCTACGAGRDPEWRRDAINELRARAAMASAGVAA
jgi:hypothetical protein